MKQNLLKTIALGLMAMVGVSAWADEVISLIPSKDGLVRTKTGSDTDASKNFDKKNGNAIISINNLPDGDSNNKFVGLLGFDLSTVKTKLDAGYTIKKVALRVTNLNNNSNTLNIFKYGDSWEEGTITWATSSHATYIAEGSLATLATKSYNSKPSFETGLGTTQANPYDISNRQSTLEVGSGSFFTYVKNAVANSTVSFCMTTNNSAETQLFSKDMSTTNWTATTTEYAWNSTSSKWEKVDPENTSFYRFDAVKRYFGLDTDEKIADGLYPHLIITLEEPASPTNQRITSLKDAWLRNDNASTNYNDKYNFGLKSNSDKQYGFSGLLSFDITPIQQRLSLGYTINTAKVILTNGFNNNKNIGLYKFSESWVDNTVTYESVEDALATAYTDANKVATGKLVTESSTKPFDLSGTGHSISSYQSEHTGAGLVTYISEATTSTLSFLLVNTDDAVEATVFRKDASKTKYNNNTRYEAMLTAFGMTESEFMAAVAPKLVVTLTAPTNETYTLEVSSAGAATLVLPYEATIPGSVSVYKLGYEENATSVTTSEVTGTLAANIPVLVLASQGNYDFVSTTTDASVIPGSNQTVGALTGVYAETTVPNTAYTLNYTSTYGVGFYKSNGSKKVRPFRAYMSVGDLGSGAPAYFDIDFNNGTTGIRIVSSEANTQMNDGIYNLQGVRVENPQKGIYIKNGKKYVVK
jgi:hypothetical protein